MISKEKVSFRRICIQRLQNLSPKIIEHKSIQIAKNLQQSEIWQKSDEILLYLSFGHEVHTQHILRVSLQEGKKVWAPRIYRNSMTFFPVNSEHGPFQVNKWGIKEPLEQEICFDLDNFSNSHPLPLILVPGLGFDLKGGRLGRGGGFYDRFFSNQSEKFFKLAIALEDQIFQGLPREKHDTPMNALVSENRFLLF